MFMKLEDGQVGAKQFYLLHGCYVIVATGAHVRMRVAAGESYPSNRRFGLIVADFLPENIAKYS